MEPRYMSVPAKLAVNVYMPDEVGVNCIDAMPDELVRAEPIRICFADVDPKL